MNHFELAKNIFAVIGVITTVGFVLAGGVYLYFAEGLSQCYGNKHFWEK